MSNIGITAINSEFDKLINNPQYKSTIQINGSESGATKRMSITQNQQDQIKDILLSGVDEDNLKSVLKSFPKIGSATVNLLNLKKVKGTYNPVLYSTSLSNKSANGIGAAISDLPREDLEAFGDELVRLFGLRKRNGYYNTSVGTKTKKGLGATVARFFEEEEFLNSLAV